MRTGETGHDGLQVPMSLHTHTVEWKTVWWSEIFHKATFWICWYL